MGQVTAARTRWGRARFGGGSARLLSLSIICGVMLAAGMGSLFGLLVATPEHQLLASSLFAVMVLPVSGAIFWALFVDRDSLRGAIADPEASIESHWYDKAAASTFTDLLLVLGLGGAIFSFAPFEANVGTVLAAVIVLLMADFAVRYRMLSRAEG